LSQICTKACSILDYSIHRNE